jgi:hypothetical protein
VGRGARGGGRGVDNVCVGVYCLPFGRQRSQKDYKVSTQHLTLESRIQCCKHTQTHTFRSDRALRNVHDRHVHVLTFSWSENAILLFW